MGVRTIVRKGLTALVMAAAAVLPAANAQAQPRKPAGVADGDSAYLFAYFTGRDESVYFAVSRNGYDYRSLNRNLPVISPDSTSATGGMRDPHILRSEDGRRYYMVATDMNVAKNGWTPNYGMVLLQSEDLVHWKHSRVNIKERYPFMGAVDRVWAPQTIYDKEKQRYMIYWSTRAGKGTDRIWYAYANKAFTALETRPALLFEGPQGGSCIDADIIEKDGWYHLYYKTEGDGNGIKQAVARKLTGPYRQEDRYLQQTKDPVEGSGVFRLNGSDRYILMYDVYTKGRYEFLETEDLRNFRKVSRPVTMNFKPRHGTVLPISGAEYDRLVAAFPEAGNPVLGGFFADPDILYSEQTGRYYIYPTSDGYDNWSGDKFRVFSSADLHHWQDEGVILDLPKDLVWAKSNAWAPCIIEKKTTAGYQYYYYFTAGKKIGVAVADAPTGPFRDLGRPLIAEHPEGVKGGQVIDPDVFRDPQSGRTYLYWGNGYMAVAELNEDMVSLKPGTTRVITPVSSYNEGTHVFYRKGKYYFTWSENDTRSPDYQVRYGVADDPVGKIRVPADNLVLAKDTAAGIYGTGHHSVINIPGTDDWYIVYHRFQYPDGIGMGAAAGYHREVAIDKLEFNADGSIRRVRPTHKGITAFSVKGQREEEFGTTRSGVLEILERVNDYWQERHPEHGRAFWDNAAYHTGNMEAWKVTGKERWRRYSEAWSERNQWKGAKSDDRSRWKYNYGETDEHVLFGDWQICFQTYVDLYRHSPAAVKIARAREVMEYQMGTDSSDYWWWADGLYMVMPVMTKLYQVTGNRQYLDKLYEYFSYANSIMYDQEAKLYYRDAKYVYPKHRSVNGKKDFWARGDGWVFAGLAKVLQDLPADDIHRAEYLEKYRGMAEALKAAQQPGGYWTRSLLDPQHAPGPETSGTAFYTYAYLWGINNGYLDRATYLPVAVRAWNYLVGTALQADGKIGYVQPIGEKAIPGQVVDSASTSNFGVGAFLLAAAELSRYLDPAREGGQQEPQRAVRVRVTGISEGWAKNSVNAVAFRKNSLVSWQGRQYIAFYDAEQRVVLGRRNLDEDRWELRPTAFRGRATDAHNSISIMVDGSGYLHLSWDHHDNALRYARSVAPGSLELRPAEMTGRNEGSVSYPEFYRLPEGDLLFFYRDGRSGQGNLVINRYEHTKQRWQQVQQSLLNGEGKRNAYWQACVDRAGVVHLSWTWRETPDVASNHDIAYAKSADGGRSWQRSDGTACRLPITAGNAEYAVRVPQGSELINQVSMETDDDGRPYIASYWRGQGSAVPQYHLVYQGAGGQWKDLELGFRTQPFRLSGGGTKRIPIARPQVAVRGRGDSVQALVLFRDLERGQRPSVVVVSDLARGRYRVLDLADHSLGAWEPGYDIQGWKERGQLDLFLQPVEQADGEGMTQVKPSQVSVLQWDPSADLAGKTLFRIGDPDYRLSPYTGMTRRHWKAAALYLLQGAFGYLQTIDDPLVFPKQPGKSYPRNEGQRVTEKLEGLSRTLFLAAALLREEPGLRINGIGVADYYRHQLGKLTDSSSDLYIRPRSPQGGPSQTLVEFGALALSFSLAPQSLWDPMPQQQKDRLAATMLSYGDGPTVPSNWKFFNIFVLSFFRDKGYPVNDRLLEDYLQQSLAHYRGGGWYNDNPAYDYYSSWGFQMYGMLWAEWYGKKFFPQYAERFRANFRELESGYPYMFGRNAEMILWGRSISYRFAAITPMPLMSFLGDSSVNLGWMRRIASGNLLQFLQHPDFLEDGVPTLGFYGPFEPAVQGYSCRGSVYWMAKAFFALLLPQDDPFWTAVENEGGWPAAARSGAVNNIFQEGSQILQTVYPEAGATEIRAWCKVKVKGNWEDFRGSENYNRLSYNSAFPWQADGQGGEVAMNYVLKNREGNWEPLRLYDFKKYTSGVYYREAVLETDSTVRIQLADMPLRNGILRVDRVLAGGPVDLRLGHYALPELTTPLRRWTGRAGGREVQFLDNGQYQLAVVSLRGWDRMETLETSGLHPVARKSGLINLADRWQPGSGADGYYITLLLWKRSGESWTEADLHPIRKLVTGRNGVTLKMAEGDSRKISFLLPK